MMKQGIFILAMLAICACTSRETPVDKGKLLGNDYRLFQGTILWDLAKAIDDNNIKAAEKFIASGVDINYREPRFGQTILFLTIRNRQLKATKFLLEHGANVNVHETYSDETPLILASDMTDVPIACDFIKILLNYGANPNTIQVDSSQRIEYPKSKPINSTALIAACSDVFAIKEPLPKVKLLVEAGADINYVGNHNVSPLREALYCKNYDVALYLLEKGVNLNSFCPINEKCDSTGAFHILEFLRGKLLEFNSKEYEYKMKVVAFLKTKGLDYWQQPIPPRMVEEIKDKYPDNWKEYLEKY
ncbi:MAG: ankyrin repeat domain-containing protein [Bacteroidetes bacterium]|nr:ankyrin repeat domain-containing protein [Bacteroidota bacterium]